MGGWSQPILLDKGTLSEPVLAVGLLRQFHALKKPFRHPIAEPFEEARLFERRPPSLRHYRHNRFANHFASRQCRKQFVRRPLQIPPADAEVAAVRYHPRRLPRDLREWILFVDATQILANR